MYTWMTVNMERCAYYVQKRGRNCRMLAAKGSIYCGEHLIHDRNLVTDSDKPRQRIPCPLDPSHTVFEDALPKHLKKCNVAKKPKPPCYSAHINTGLLDYQPSEEEGFPLSAFSMERIDELVQKIEAVYQEHFTEVKTQILCHPALENDISDPKNGPTALKHLQQQSSILGHLDALGILSFKDTCYIEFGAGRGKLSECIQRAFQVHSDNLPSSVDVKGGTSPLENEAGNVSIGACGTTNVHYVLVDRDSCRHKVDGAHRVSGLVGARYHRLLMDIEHLDLTKLECLKEGSSIDHVVAVSKHLCGAATDLSLRCIVQSLLHKPVECPQACAESSRCCQMKSKLLGVLVALCCHHRCSWSQLVGRSFFEKLGFTPADFHIICHMSSWAVCGVRPPPKSPGDLSNYAPISGAGTVSDTVGDDEGTLLSESGSQAATTRKTGRWGYVPHPNEAIGLKCKRLIDLARLAYLKESGLRAWLVYYVDRSTSLENVLLIAVPSPS